MSLIEKSQLKTYLIAFLLFVVIGVVVPWYLTPHILAPWVEAPAAQQELRVLVSDRVISSGEAVSIPAVSADGTYVLTAIRHSCSEGVTVSVLQTTDGERLETELPCGEYARLPRVDDEYQLLFETATDRQVYVPLELIYAYEAGEGFRQARVVVSITDSPADDSSVNEGLDAQF